MSKKWQPGDRVTRTVYTDDGTWQREGDACLPYSPRYTGTVVRRNEDRDDEVVVIFDGTTQERMFLDHGLVAEEDVRTVVREGSRPPIAAPRELIRLDLRSCTWESRYQFVWQQLFNFYRENDCSLDRMHNLLVDYQNCWQAVEDTLRGPVRFLWGCLPGSYETTWINESSWKEVGLRMCMLCSSLDWFVECALVEDEASFIVHGEYI